MKLQNLSYKILFSIFFFAVAGIIFFLKIGGKTTNVSAAWWNSNWHYRRSITLTNSTGAGKTNVLIKVLENYNLSSFVSAGKLQSDLDDLRFTDSNDTAINYWIEDSTNTSADIWVRIPSLPTSGTSIWMYYGNLSATGSSIPPFSYTGSSQIISDGNSKFRVKFFTSGTFNPISNMTIDVFLVGGGGGGSYYGGGGGGYTNTHSAVSITANTNYGVTIGAGGGSNGGSTTGFGYTANGGVQSSYYIGGNGGSGGGAGLIVTGSGWPGAGGSNGGNGAEGCNGDTYACTSGGSGQGTTTREFGESSGDLYAGGGGGHLYYTTWNYHAFANGGAGGGGTQSNGAANTGGGGAGDGYSGGSGIAVVRYTSPGTSSINPTEEVVPTPTPTPPNSLPASTQCLIEESPNDTNLKIKWLDNTTLEEAYYIEKSTDGGSWTNIYTSGPNATSYTDTNISSNHTYQYRIAPHNVAVTNHNWCYTSTLNLGRGNFNFEGLNLEGVNID